MIFKLLEFQFDKFIGKGAAGHAYEGFLKKDKTRVAIKVNIKKYFKSQ